MNDITKVGETLNAKELANTEVLGKKFSIFGDLENPLFLAKDVADWIGLTNVTDMIKRCRSDEKLIIDMGGLRGRCNFITKSGIYRIIANSHKGMAVKIRNKWDLKKYSNNNKESIFMSYMVDILNLFGVKSKCQYYIKPYFIDLYIPEYKIAIEYDECQHKKPVNVLKDKERENYIKTKLGCKFIRLNSLNSNIENEVIVLKQILKLK